LRPERWLAHLVAWLWGAPTARRALRLATRLYGTADFQARWRRCRFLIRTLWYGRASKRWFAFLDAKAFRRRLTRQQPEWAEKPHRPYRRHDLDADTRLACLVSHTLALERLGWQELVLRLSHRPLPIARFIGKDEVERWLELAHAGQFMKEGELCLHLCSGGRRLYSAAFSLIGAPVMPLAPVVSALDIGCLQGPDDPTARALVRSTTKALHGLRPRDLMVVALKALAETLAAPSLIGVAGSRHVYRHWRKRRAFSFDYDGFWAEHAGRPRDDGDYELSSVCLPKPIDQVPSNKRAEARRRQALVADIQCQIGSALDGRAGRSEAVAQTDEHAVTRRREQQRAVAPRREHTADDADTRAHQHIAEPMGL
jgi:uncharacterized protein VirK/YbjX